MQCKEFISNRGLHLLNWVQNYRTNRYEPGVQNEGYFYNTAEKWEMEKKFWIVKMFTQICPFRSLEIIHFVFLKANLEHVYD